MWDQVQRAEEISGAGLTAFPVELVKKDLSYLASGIEPSALPISVAASGVFARAIQACFANENMTAVAKVYD